MVINTKNWYSDVIFQYPALLRHTGSTSMEWNKHLPTNISICDYNTLSGENYVPLPSSCSPARPLQATPITLTHSLWSVLLFRENSQDELSLLVRLVRGGDDDILSGAQAEALGHFAQVDVGLAASLGGVEQEEVLLHVLLVPMHLERGSHNSKSEICWMETVVYIKYTITKTKKKNSLIVQDYCRVQISFKLLVHCVCLPPLAPVKRQREHQWLSYYRMQTKTKNLWYYTDKCCYPKIAKWYSLHICTYAHSLSELPQTVIFKKLVWLISSWICAKEEIIKHLYVQRNTGFCANTLSKSTASE